MKTHRPILIVVALALSGCGQTPDQIAAPSPQRPAAPVEQQSPAGTIAAPAAIAELDLRERARIAMEEGRILSPAGDNSFELFLELRETVADNRDLSVALYDLMPFAGQAAKLALDRDELAEAERIVGLMERFDASSAITHTSRERVTLYQQEAERAEVKRQEIANVVSPKPAVPVVASPPSARKTPAPTIPATPRPAAVVATPVPVAAPVARVEPPAPARQPAVDFIAPMVVRRAPAQYPPQAKRQGLSGVVELDLLVDESGNPKDIRVVRAEPEGTFDLAAIRSVMRWKFEPAKRNGQIEAARTRAVVQFKQG